MSGKNLAGVRIAHDLDDFIEDHEIVLTLKDQGILDKDGLKGDGDVLENVYLSEDFKNQQALKMKKKKLGLESYDDDQEKKSILPQYDEPKMEKDGFMLDSHGEYNQDRIKKAESIKFALSKKKANVESLDTSRNIQSEYMTEEENVGFKVPKKKKNFKKAQEDILKFLEENIEQTTEDHGNRQSRGSKEEEDLKERVEKKQKQDNYNQALDNAQKKTKQARRPDDDGYGEVEQMIEITRRIMQKKEQPAENSLKNFLDQNKNIEFQMKSKNSEQQQETISTIKVDENEKKEDITSLKMDTEFLKNLATEAQINQNQIRQIAPTPLSMKDSRDGTASIINVALPTEKMRAHSKNAGGINSIASRHTGILSNNLTKGQQETGKEPMMEEEEEEEEEEKPEDTEKMKDEVTFLEEESVGKGMFKTLGSLRDRGMLDKVHDVTGRAKDKNYDTVKKAAQGGDERVKLEYRDEKGRLMTPKQAFRYQCYIFHGKKPSKNKQEKQRKKQEQEKKIKGVAPGQSVMMRALAKSQENNTQSYMVLSNNNGK